MVINLPIAYFLGSVFSVIDTRLFAPGMIISYWLTNILGIVMMHTATLHMLPTKISLQLVDQNKPDRQKNQILTHVIIAGIYTFIISFLIALKVIKPLNLSHN